MSSPARKRLWIALPVALIALFGLLVGRTLATSSLQPHPEAVGLSPVNGEAVALRLGEAVRFATVTRDAATPADPAPFDALLRWMPGAWPAAHAVLKRETVGRHGLLYTWAGSDRTLAPLLLLAHSDVVPVDPKTTASWTHPPFSGKVADGFVWGRGTLDDKLSLVSILEAADLLAREGFGPKRTVMFAFGHDEEVGGQDGARRLAALLKDRGVRPFLVLDEGLALVEGVVPGLSAPLAAIGVSEKGYVSLVLTAEGDEGHSSMPPRRTSVGALARALDRLQDRPFASRLTAPVREGFRWMGPEMGFGTRLVFANLWLFEPLLRWQLGSKRSTDATTRTTIAPTMLTGSDKDNVLPRFASATVNFRTLPGDTIESVTAHVRAAIDDDRVRVELAEGFASNAAAVSPSSGEAWDLLVRTVAEVMPEAVVAPGLVVGATDARHYGGLTPNVYRFAPMRLGPDDLPRIHGTDERVAVGDLARAVQFYRRLIRQACRPTPAPSHP